MSEQEGLTVKKSEDFSEWYTQVVAKAGLADLRYRVKGFLVHMPWSVRVMKAMYELFEAELEKSGHEPVWFPAVIPESYFEKEKEHAAGFVPEVFWVTEAGADKKKLEEPLALRPTSETAIYSMFSMWIRSWRDLPFKTYQSCQVWRYEPTTRPFIRGREFYWIEAHDAFATEKEALGQVGEDMKTTERVVHGTFALPFLVFRRPQHDKFKGAVDTYAADAVMPDGRVLQLPSTHMLGQNFSKPFNVKFVDTDSKERNVWQTCYGPAVWRIFGAIVATHGDDKGLVLPPALAPLQAVIVPIYYDKDKPDVMKKANELRAALEKAGLRCKIDDSDRTPGWKFNQWELKGVPVRVEVGSRDILKKQVVLVRRDTGKKEFVPEKTAPGSITKILDEIQNGLVKRAEELLAANTRNAKSYDELKKNLDKGGFVRAEWCGEKSCADEIKAETAAGVRGTLFSKSETPKGACVHCEKKSKFVVYFARAY